MIGNLLQEKSHKTRLPRRRAITPGGADLVVRFGGFYGERGSASLYGGLGAEPPLGSRGKAPGQGAKPPEADDILTFETPN